MFRVRACSDVIETEVAGRKAWGFRYGHAPAGAAAQSCETVAVKGVTCHHAIMHHTRAGCAQEDRALCEEILASMQARPKMWRERPSRELLCASSRSFEQRRCACPCKGRPPGRPRTRIHDLLGIVVRWKRGRRKRSSTRELTGVRGGRRARRTGAVRARIGHRLVATRATSTDRQLGQYRYLCFAW